MGNLRVMDPSSTTHRVSHDETLGLRTQEDHEERSVADANVNSRPSTIALPSYNRGQEAIVQQDEGAPFLPSDDESTSSVTKHNASSTANALPTSSGRCDWLPLTLRLPFLGFLIILSLLLGVVLSVLTAYSARHDGLGNDDNSSALLFGWRFSPTLVATIYSLLVGSMLNDVRRTEVFARLSRPGGATAAHTLCFPARSWWHDPFDALSKTKNNGFRSLALFSASLVNILVLLVVSPLSAGLFSPLNIEISRDTSFRKANLAPEFTWKNDSFDSTVFRTIAGSVLNKSTSAWITTDFAVLPFSPHGSSSPLGSSFASDFSSQKWQSQSTVFKSELDCVPLSIAGTSSLIVEDVGTSGSTILTTLRLSSSDGCNVTITEDEDSLIAYHGGWLPKNPQNIDSILGQYGSFKTAGNCGNRSTIFVRDSDGKKISLDGNVCSTSFYAASVDVTVDINEASTTVSFDADEYLANRQLLDPVKYDLPHLEDSFLNSNWSNKFFGSIIYATPSFSGPLLAIAASPDFNNDIDIILNSTDLIERASRLHQQYLGEMLLLTLDTTSDRVTNFGPGQTHAQERRIVVISSIGITLTVLVFLSAGCILAVAFTTRSRTRALHLSHDPGSITAAASLIAADSHIKREFEGTDQYSNTDLTSLLAERHFSMTRGGVLIASDPDAALKKQNNLDGQALEVTQATDPRPAVIRIWMGSLLFLILAALIAAIAALFKVSRTAGLYQSALVTQLNVDVFELTTTLTPYSIIPTLLAVGVKLWFRAIGETFKRLQPFVSVARSPASTSNSISAEYANTPIALASIKAMKHSHWILALIGAGAFVTEAFTVGMSALWDRELKDTKHVFAASRQLELRSSPKLYHHQRQHSSLSAKEAVLESVFDASLQNWLYGAAIELTQSASTPPWSKDTWSFVPLDEQALLNASSLLNSSARNITIQTPALRARLECETVDYASNTSAWITETDFRNRTLWNATNAPSGLDHGWYLNGIAEQGPGLRSVACCANNTQTGPGDAAVGYWTDLSTSSPPLSMMVKWIVGRPLEGLYQGNRGDLGFTNERYIWSEQPQIAAVNCTPIIEHAEASITVNFESGVVHDYEILEKPQNATDAWSDFYFYHGASKSYESHWQENITTSWGYVFWDSLLESANAGALNDMKLLYAGAEDLSDGIFNFRMPGLNTDFMSYSMLAMANNSKEALLDPATLTDLANKTFSVFFKHFASEEVNSTAGGRAYQPIGEKLPVDLGPVTYGVNISADQGALATQDDRKPTPRETEATLLVPVEQLIMSPVAVYLCIVLLAFLMLTTIIIYSVNRGHYKVLPRDVDTLASMIAFVYCSTRLLHWSQESTHTGAWYRSWVSEKRVTENSHMMAQMGTFYDAKGMERWGIELVDREDLNGSNIQHTGDGAVEMQRLDAAKTGGSGEGAEVRTALLGTFGLESSQQNETERTTGPATEYPRRSVS